ncbi:MAG: FAD-binding oxidoreductase, partial [Bacteroidetes bacterium]
MAKQVVIVGGGLAGSVLAARLAKAGCSVDLFDDGDPAAASRVAAGLYNVITGRFGAKTWLAETLLAELEAFLNWPEMAPLRTYVHPTLIYRPFREVKEYNKWTGRSAEPEFASLVAMQESPLLPDRIDNPLGGIRILPCGWIDVGGFIHCLHALLSKMGVRLHRERLDYRQIDPTRQRIHHGEDPSLAYDALVFAEGAALAHNPWLAGLQLIPNKGELLEIHAPDLQMDFALSKKIYVVPLGEDRYGVGAT